MSRITFIPMQLGGEISPRPRIIALYAACAKVAPMSGAKKHLEVFRDPEQIRVVTDDGAFHKLIGTLAKFQVVPATT